MCFDRVLQNNTRLSQPRAGGEGGDKRGREGLPMRGLGTDHLILGQMRGLKNCIQWRTQIDLETL